MADLDSEDTPRQSVTVHADNRELVRRLSNVALCLDACKNKVQLLLREVWSSPVPVAQTDVAARVSKCLSETAQAVRVAEAGP